MSWLNKHYDLAVLGVAALLALAMAAWGLQSSLSFSSVFSNRNSPKPRDNNLPALDLQPFEQRIAALDNPPRWRNHEGSFLVSRIYVLKDGNLLDPIESDSPIHPPVPNDWLLRHNLDYTQADILSQDTDSDGFTNIEEWKAGTDPTNPQAVPPLWTKLRLHEFQKISFTVLFSGSPDGGSTFAINFPDDRTRPTLFLEKGSTLELAGATYKITGYLPKTKVINDIERDVSELILTDVLSGTKLTLIAEQVHDSPTISGSFINLADGEITPMLQPGDSFTLKQNPDESYRIESLQEDGAVLLNKKTGERIEVARE